MAEPECYSPWRFAIAPMMEWTDRIAFSAGFPGKIRVWLEHEWHSGGTVARLAGHGLRRMVRADVQARDPDGSSVLSRQGPARGKSQV